MNAIQAVKILQRRRAHLNRRIEQSNGSEAALLFDRRECEAIQYAIERLDEEPEQNERIV